MKLRRFDEVDAFREHVFDFLASDEAANNLQIGLINGLKQGRFAENPPYLACVEHDDEIVMVVLRTPPHMLLLSLVADRHLRPVLFAELIEDIAATYEALPGFNGPAQVVDAFSKAWVARFGGVATPKLNMRIYSLTKLIPPAPIPGTWRFAGPDDHAQIKTWMSAFFTEAIGESLPDEDLDKRAATYARDGIDRDKQGFVIFWEIDGQPVTMCGANRHGITSSTVSLVYTPPELRGRGYASACVAALSQWLLEHGRQMCTLYTDLNFPTSNKIYMNIGYEPVCDAVEYSYTPAS